jgi:hypothetical protein
MTRNIRPYEIEKRSKARRAHALARIDLREPSSPRTSAVGPMSHSIKKMDDASAAAIKAFMERGRT